MLKNNAQIARETINTTLELPGSLSRPWTPAESEFGSALVMCVLAHNLLRPLNENPGSAPAPHLKIRESVCSVRNFSQLKYNRNVILYIDWQASFIMTMFAMNWKKKIMEIYFKHTTACQDVHCSIKYCRAQVHGYQAVKSRVKSALVSHVISIDTEFALRYGKSKPTERFAAKRCPASAG